jgi:hypothetical protein
MNSCGFAVVCCCTGELLQDKARLSNFLRAHCSSHSSDGGADVAAGTELGSASAGSNGRACSLVAAAAGSGANGAGLLTAQQVSNAYPLALGQEGSTAIDLHNSLMQQQQQCAVVAAIPAVALVGPGGVVNGVVVGAQHSSAAGQLVWCWPSGIMAGYAGGGQVAAAAAACDGGGAVQQQAHEEAAGEAAAAITAQMAAAEFRSGEIAPAPAQRRATDAVAAAATAAEEAAAAGADAVAAARAVLDAFMRDQVLAPGATVDTAAAAHAAALESAVPNTADAAAA